jgi:hypothetical protein
MVGGCCVGVGFDVYCGSVEVGDVLEEHLFDVVGYRVAWETLMV